MAGEVWRTRIDPEDDMSEDDVEAKLQQSMIMRELEEADVNVARLAELLNALEKRLRPVLIEMPMEGEAKPQLAGRADEVVSSPLSERVRSLNTMLVRVQSHLGHTMSRVDF